MTAVNPLEGQQVLNPSDNSAFVAKTTDPVVTSVSTPADFAGQFPTPLDPTEILPFCEDVTLLQFIPERRTGLKQVTWREMSSLAFTSGSAYVAFTDGACPEEYTADGANQTVDLKNIGAKKSLTISDIMHSSAVIAGGSGIEALLGGYAAGQGMPGAKDVATFGREAIADLKEKEVRRGMSLLLNGEDRLLAVGDATTRPLEFDGIESWVTAANGSHSATSSGTFSAQSFDRFLGEGCAKPQVLAGHPAAIQEVMSAYFQLGYQGSQVVNFASGDRIIPGFNFGGFINTGIGRLQVVADTNFTRTAGATGYYSSAIYGLRMNHNGEPLVVRETQIPLSLIDLAPGCTAISFELWKKTALVIKALCSQHIYTFQQWVGSVATTCTKIG